MISARIADGMGFSALYMTGYGVSASLGLPDAGLVSYTEMVERVAQICQGTSTPVVCDGDTGFGGLLNVERTVQGYEARRRRGASSSRTRCSPRSAGTRRAGAWCPSSRWCARSRWRWRSRASPDFLIVARTDARTNHGLDEALRRGEAYAKAGADILFIESPESEEEMARIGRSFDLPLIANMVEGGRTPVLPKKRLEELGYRMAIYPGDRLPRGGARRWSGSTAC